MGFKSYPPSQLFNRNNFIYVFCLFFQNIIPHLNTHASMYAQKHTAVFNKKIKY